MNSKKIASATNPIIILSLINDKESYAYDIIKQINASSKGIIIMQEGTLYPLLKKMKTNQLITSRWKNMPLGHKRKYYSITQKGKNHLKDLKQEWKKVTDVIKEFL